MCTVYTGYCGTSEIEHGLCACTVDNPSLKLGDYLSVQAHKPCSISHLTTTLDHKTCINIFGQVLEKTLFAQCYSFQNESRGVSAINKRYMFKM